MCLSASPCTPYPDGSVHADSGACLRCGKLLPAPPPTSARNTAFERAFTNSAVTLVGRMGYGGIRADELNQFAEHRAGADPVRDLMGRDWAVEGREEGGDHRNYLCWDALALFESGRDDDAAREAHEWMRVAMAGVILAFHAHTKARELLR